MFKLRNLINFYKYKRKLNVLYLSYNNYCSSGLKILFFGTDNFSLPSLKVLHNESKKKSKLSALGVVTSLKNPSNCVKIYASKHPEIDLHGWPVTPEFCNKYSLGVVVSFGHLIPEKIISSFPFGMINLHASILPRWRGAAPIIHAIMKGDEKTGVTIMKIEPKRFDVGDILCKTEININPDVLMPELHQNLAIQGANLLIETIRSSPEIFKNFKKQDESLVTYAPKILPTFTEIKWNKMSAKEIYDLYRALYSYKNLSTKFKLFNIKIIELRYKTKSAENLKEKHPQGFIKYSKNDQSLKVFCENGDFVEILQLKIEGKKVINAQDFNNGFLKKCNETERYFK